MLSTLVNNKGDSKMTKLVKTVKVAKNKQAELNNAIKEYEQIGAVIKDMTKRRDELKKFIMEVCPDPAKYETNMFTILISLTSGRANVSGKAVLEKYPKIFEELGGTITSDYKSIRSIDKISGIDRL